MGGEAVAKTCRVRVRPGVGGEQTLWAEQGQTLWDVLVDAGLLVPGDCGGQGFCGACVVQAEGRLSAPGEEEQELLAGRAGRLACHCRVLGDCRVTLPGVEARAARLPVAAACSPLRPLLRATPLHLQRGQAPDLRQQVGQALPGVRLAPPAGEWESLKAARQGEHVRGVLRRGELVALLTAPDRPLWGVALDVGSTTLFGELVDLESGASRAAASLDNPQRRFGADIVSRLTAALGSREAHRALTDELRAGVGTLLRELAAQAGGEAQDIHHLVVAGNPVMVHFLLGWEVEGLSRHPLALTHPQGVEVEAAALELPAHQRALVQVLPQVGGMVGADTVAGLLALGPQAPHRFLLVDIGTNGEIALRDGERWWACSAAAGPAFEGGSISRGMRARPGAVDRAWVRGEEIRFGVVGGGTPRGICGSGLVDLVAALLALGRLQPDGWLQAPSPGDGERRYVLWPGGPDEEVALTQGDIRQLQLAKGALRAGAELLLRRAGLRWEELAAVYLAGAFGNSLHVASAVAIGLLPPLSAHQVVAAGNTAARGARRVLLDAPAWGEALALAQRIEYVELALQSDFQEVFVASLNFPA